MSGGQPILALVKKKKYVKLCKKKHSKKECNTKHNADNTLRASYFYLQKLLKLIFQKCICSLRGEGELWNLRTQFCSSDKITSHCDLFTFENWAYVIISIYNILMSSQTYLHDSKVYKEFFCHTKHFLVSSEFCTNSVGIKSSIWPFANAVQFLEFVSYDRIPLCLLRSTWWAKCCSTVYTVLFTVSVWFLISVPSQVNLHV